MPRDARGRFELADPGSGLSVAVRLDGALPSEAIVDRGRVLYSSAHPDGADLWQRPTRDGVEDFLAYHRRPRVPEARFWIDLGAKVAGLRLVANTLELLDASGAPRLRASPPLLLSGTARHPARLALAGCAADRNPAPPWGRPVTAPGSRHCLVSVTWNDAGLSYPALLDPSWTGTTSMSVPRGDHASVTLSDGRVLIAGGQDYTGGAGVIHQSAEIYDPASGTFAAVADMNEPRTIATATRLLNGDVLLVGGLADGTGGTGPNNYSGTTDRYVAASGTWQPGTLPAPAGTLTDGSPIPNGRAFHSAVLLGGAHAGDVLIAGGYAGNSNGIFPPGFCCMVSLSAAVRYHPDDGSFVAVAPMPEPRDSFGLAAEATGGRVVMAGGAVTTNEQIVEQPTTSYVYDADADAWTQVNDIDIHPLLAVATRLADGRVLLTGGGYLVTPIFNFSTSTWSGAIEGGVLRTSRVGNAVTLLTSGGVLLAGGNFGGPALASAEIFDVATRRAWAIPDMSQPRVGHGASAISNGRVLITGGASAGTYLSSAEVLSLDANGTDCSTPVTCASGISAGGVCCGTACAGTGQSCASGTCAACAAGTTNCDGQSANGCETDTASSVTNCGVCGNDCSASVQNGTGVACSDGSCTFASCAAGFASCDGSTDNGCEMVDPGPAVTPRNDGTGFARSLVLSPDGGIESFSLTDGVESTADVCGSAVALSSARIVRITSDEVSDGGRATGADMTIISPTTFSLRRWRNGSGDGRVYAVVFDLTDAFGNVTRSSFKIQVPHDGGGTSAIDSGPQACVGDC